MDKKYRVLWVDDKYAELHNIHQQAIDSHIELTCFDNAESANLELDANFRTYDAVILDGLFYDQSTESGDVTSQRALMKVVRKIRSLEGQKKLPWFILTGKAVIKSENDFITAENKQDDIFDKLDPNDIQKLYRKIKVEVDSQFDSQIIHKFQSPFSIFDNHLGIEHKINLLKVIKTLQAPEGSLFFNEYNSIRAILELLVQKLRNLEIVCPEIPNLNGASSFLGRVNPGYIYNVEIVHPFIAELLFKTLSISQDGSHDKPNLRFRVQEYSKKHSAKYAYLSTVYSLLEILEYFNKFLNENQDVPENKSKWKKKIISGE